ncbi:MAG: hypothetical protein Q9169_004872 [Polycauliona sp. 2 TL-2023]
MKPELSCVALSTSHTKSNESSKHLHHLITMAQHEGLHSERQASDAFLEILPSAKYVPGTRKASFTDIRRPFSGSRSIDPTPEQVKAVVNRSRRSSSASTASSVSSSYDGDKSRFLHLVPETDE